MLRILVAFALIISFALPISAQDRSQPEEAKPAQGSLNVTEGTRVRVYAPGIFREPVVGRVSDIGLDTLVLQKDESPREVRLPLNGIEQVERSGGTKNYVLLGAGVGLMVGGLTGFAVASFGNDSDEDSAPLSSIGELDEVGEGVGYTLIGAALGAVIGTVIGGVASGERWEPVPFAPVAVAPGASLSFRISLTVPSPL